MKEKIEKKLIEKPLSISETEKDLQLLKLEREFENFKRTLEETKEIFSSQ